MYIHFTTQNFKHDAENFGYVGNPGLVDHNTRKNEIIAGCYVDVDDCYITDGTTYDDSYEPFNFHGFVTLRKNAEDDDHLIGFIAEDASRIWHLNVYGTIEENENGDNVGKIIRVAIIEQGK